MQLFLLRHAEAGPYIPDDASRQLTLRGRQQVRAIAQANAQALAAISHIWVSPYVRAQQTLQTISPFLPAEATTITCDWLTPDSPLQGVLQHLALQPPLAGLILISHQPLLGDLLNSLCHLSPGQYSLGTSALASLECEHPYPGCAQLNWVRQP